MLCPAQRSKVSHAVLHLLPEGLQRIQHLTAIRGKIVDGRTFPEHFQEIRIGPGGVGIAGTVAAIVTDVGSLIALRSRRSRLGAPVQHTVQAGGLVPVGHHLLPHVHDGSLGSLHQAEEGNQLALFLDLGGLVAAGRIHQMRSGISESAHTHGSGTAAVHVQGIAGMEVALDETGKFTGVHALAVAGPASVHDNHEEVPVLRQCHGGTGMPHTLVTDGVLIIVFQNLCSGERAVHEGSTHRSVVIDEHGRAGKDVFPGRCPVELALLSNGFSLSVGGDADILPRCIGVDGAVILPVGNGRCHHRVFGHAGMVGTARLDHDGLRLVGRIHRSHCILPAEDAGSGALDVGPDQTEGIALVSHVPVNHVDFLGGSRHRLHAAEVVIRHAIGNDIRCPAFTGRCLGKSQE